jgi:hypothetical protein
MTIEDTPTPRQPPGGLRGMLRRSDVLSGLMFISFGVVGLAMSWDYAIGTAIRMGTGYVPRMFLWILLAIGLLVLAIGLRQRGDDAEVPPPLVWRPLIFITLALVVFAQGMSNDLGFVVSGMLLIMIGGLAHRNARPWEVLIIAVALVASCWVIFIWALGLVIPVWPGG